MDSRVNGSNQADSSQNLIREITCQAAPEVIALNHDCRECSVSTHMGKSVRGAESQELSTRNVRHNILCSGIVDQVPSENGRIFELISRIKAGDFGGLCSISEDDLIELILNRETGLIGCPMLTVLGAGYPELDFSVWNAIIKNVPASVLERCIDRIINLKINGDFNYEEILYILNHLTEQTIDFGPSNLSKRLVDYQLDNFPESPLIDGFMRKAAFKKDVELMSQMYNERDFDLLDRSKNLKKYSEPVVLSACYAEGLLADYEVLIILNWHYRNDPASLLVLVDQPEWESNSYDIWYFIRTNMRLTKPCSEEPRTVELFDQNRVMPPGGKPFFENFKGMSLSDRLEHLVFKNVPGFEYNQSDMENVERKMLDLMDWEFAGEYQDRLKKRDKDIKKWPELQAQVMTSVFRNIASSYTFGSDDYKRAIEKLGLPKVLEKVLKYSPEQMAEERYEFELARSYIQFLLRNGQEVDDHILKLYRY